VSSYTALSVAGFTNARPDAVDPPDLALRVAAGDRDAFVSAYRSHFAEVRAFAERLLGCPMAADDLVHDVFVGLPRALRGFRGECLLSSYLISIAIRLSRSHLRAATRRRALEARVFSEPAPPPAQPDREIEQRELAALLTAALDRLPLDQRVAFVLCEVEERTSSEVGRILGEQPGTVRARVFHAKRRLRAELGEVVRDSGSARAKGEPR